MSDLHMRIYGMQRAQADNQQMLMASKPEGEFGEAVDFAVKHALAYAIRVTHVDRGWLKASHRGRRAGLKGMVYIAPQGGEDDPAEYGPYEHARGGSHAFYDRTIEEAGDQIAKGALKIMAGAYAR